MAELMRKAGVSGWSVTRQPMANLVPSGKCTECAKPVGKPHSTGCLMLEEVPSETGSKLVELDHTTVLVEAPGVWGLVRVDPEAPYGFRHLGHTTREVNPVAIEVRAEVLADILKNMPGAKPAQAGPLWEGAGAFVSVRVPDLVSVGKTDTLDMRAVLVNSLVPGRGSVLRVMPMHNTTQTVLPVVLPGLPGRVELSPEDNKDARITEASEGLDLLTRMAEQMEETATRLLRKKMSVKEALEFADTVLKDKAMPTHSALQHQQYEDRKQYMSAWVKGETLMPECKGSRWTALMAVLFHAQHVKVVKPTADARRVRATSTLFPKQEALNTTQIAWDLITQGL
ncbi:DUF932 domain-containing protein [Actinosynnema mirum]|uniref:DUF932 domain-containing protein n=1 Tax=Actinosynnema mirum TaxID=40567 RepID=UPI0016511BF9|nr:DUF932 domain-containing protein [Actinosynnema mirum]